MSFWVKIRMKNGLVYDERKILFPEQITGKLITNDVNRNFIFLLYPAAF
jgi:hypothetical protein